MAFTFSELFVYKRQTTSISQELWNKLFFYKRPHFLIHIKCRVLLNNIHGIFECKYTHLLCVFRLLYSVPIFYSMLVYTALIYDTSDVYISVGITDIDVPDISIYLYIWVYLVITIAFVSYNNFVNYLE